MKNLLFVVALLALVFVLIHSVLLCIDKEQELKCIQNLNLDEDISVCNMGVKDDE